MNTRIELDQAALTGAVRFRSERSFGGREKLILQVEVTFNVPDRLHGPTKLQAQTAWRDATLRDITKATIKPEKLA